MKASPIIFLLSLACCTKSAALSTKANGGVKKHTTPASSSVERRHLLSSAATTLVGGLLIDPGGAKADSAAVQDSLDIDNFLRTGVDAGGGMGVSSQAGKSRPQTGVVFRDGTDVLQDRSGSVLAEILTGTKENPVAVLTTFTSSKWKLETGTVFDVECRDPKTGDGAFLAVTGPIANGQNLADLPPSFFLDRLFDPTGRFSFYGPPTDIRVKKSEMRGDNYRLIEVGFSNLSQSTNAELPRRALVAATIPAGTNNAVMLVGSASAARWKKGADADVIKTIESFRATPSPKTSLKVRAKKRGEVIEF